VWNTDTCLLIACVCVLNFLSGAVQCVLHASYSDVAQYFDVRHSTVPNASTNVFNPSGYTVLPVTLPTHVTIFTPQKFNSNGRLFRRMKVRGNAYRYVDGKILFRRILQICSRYVNGKDKQVRTHHADLRNVLRFTNDSRQNNLRKPIEYKNSARDVNSHIRLYD
jgi:hypothetical protein